MKEVRRLRKILYVLLTVLVFTVGCSTNEPAQPENKSGAVEISEFKLGSPMIIDIKTATIILNADATTSITNAPRWLHADKTFVKAYFSLPTGATAASNGMALSTGGTIDLSSGTTSIVVTKGSLKTTYTITLVAYNAESNPYGVYTAGDLSDVRMSMAATDKYKLMNDISLPNMADYNFDPDGMSIPDYASSGWMPLGDVGVGYRNPFNSGFDGNGYVINNLNIVRSVSKNVGLFGVTGAKSNIKNLGVNVSAGKVIGIMNVGALVGINNGGKVTNCYVKGEAVKGQNQIGGLVGYNYGGGSVSNSYATVAVEGMNKVGGLVGYNESSTVFNSYATGSVKGVANTSNHVGGLVGNNSSGIVRICYSTGAVSGAEFVGGFIGTNLNSPDLGKCYWDINTGAINGKEDATKGVGNAASVAGVTGKTTSEMKADTPFDDAWTATNWVFTAGEYPRLVIN